MKMDASMAELQEVEGSKWLVCPTADGTNVTG